MAAEPNAAPPSPAPSALALPPPRMSVGAAGWIRANLFGNWFDSLLTVVLGAALALGAWYGLSWVFLDADWTVVTKLGGRFVIGQYNTTEACPGSNCFWRPQVALMLVTALLAARGQAGNDLAKWVLRAVKPSVSIGQCRDGYVGGHLLTAVARCGRE